MGSIFEQLEDAAKQFLIDLISGNLSDMFRDVNDSVGDIAGHVGQTPQAWNTPIFVMIQALSQSVIIPIAGLIITYVLCYELITMITERNNMRDFDTYQMYLWVFKAGVATWVVTHTFDLVMAIFDVAQHVVQSSAGIISGTASIDIDAALAGMRASLEAMSVAELMMLALETFVMSFIMQGISVLILVILFGRMVEIYISISIAPIPFATFANREWGSIGNNYLRGLLALGFQGFFIMVCVAIYAALVNSLTISSDIHGTLISIAVYTFLLCFSLMKTGSVSRSIFNAH